MFSFIDSLSRPAHPALIATVGTALLLGPYQIQKHIEAHVLARQRDREALKSKEDPLSLTLNHARDLTALKVRDVGQFKAGMTNLAQSKKTLYEAGLSLQEEKRLLEKQWDILTTYLVVNASLQRIFLMRGDQPLESYLIAYVPIKAFGGLPQPLPRIVRIVSKERFAYPERGYSELENGSLQWQPPQVGTSVRSKALGEYVMFTNSHLILHGPPINPADHEAFPHFCLGLSREAAQKLYRHSFIGTKIMLAPQPGDPREN